MIVSPRYVLRTMIHLQANSIILFSVRVNSKNKYKLNSLWPFNIAKLQNIVYPLFKANPCLEYQETI